MQYALRNPHTEKRIRTDRFEIFFAPHPLPQSRRIFRSSGRQTNTTGQKIHHMLQFYQNIWWFLFEVRFYSLVAGYISFLQRLNLNANSRPPTRIATVTASNIHCLLPCAVPALFCPILGKGA